MLSSRWKRRQKSGVGWQIAHGRSTGEGLDDSGMAALPALSAANLDTKRMADLDRAFNLTQSGNSEILADWLLMAIRSGYQPAYPKLDTFLVEVGRRKYIKPLYQELAKTPKGKEHAKAVYAKARPGISSDRCDHDRRSAEVIRCAIALLHLNFG